MAKAKRKTHRIGRAEKQAANDLQDAASIAGLPAAQRGHDIVLVDTVQIGSEPNPIKRTVRKLTQVERLARARVLEPHEAAACEWYADRHALGFDTVGCTANYEGASGGGFDGDALMSRSVAQQRARDDCMEARGKLPTAYIAIFEAIICRNDLVSQIAAASFDLGRSQAEHRVRKVLKFCANIIGCYIGAELPIEAPAPPRLVPVVAEPVSLMHVAKAPPRPVSASIDADLDRLEANGVDVAEIWIAPVTLAMLEIETGCREHYRGVPLTERESFGWGHVPVAAEQI